MHKYVHIWKKGEFNLLYNIALNLGAPTQPNFFLFVNIIILFFVKGFVQTHHHPHSLHQNRMRK